MSNELKLTDKTIKKGVKLFRKGLGFLINSSVYFTTTEKRITLLKNGCIILYIFAITTLIAASIVVPGIFGQFSMIGDYHESPWIWGILTSVLFLIEAALFWIGIIIVYLTSIQLGVKIRVAGAICALIPVANAVMFSIILYTVTKELQIESKKIKLNQSRKDKQICKTKYPILLVHGVFFRDSAILNYWGRIPSELHENGATIFYGNHDSASPIRVNAKHLARRIKEIIEQTGCEKVNIIAHSKGGLDSRAAIATTDIAPYVASLTTINTPHRGCQYGDYLMNELSESELNAFGKIYNSAALDIGDENPDFLPTVRELTASYCEKFNQEILDNPNVFYQSVGSIQNGRSAGRMPLNLTYPLVNSFDGENDGLVGYKSFQWGEKFQLIRIKGHRGISHADIIDLNRDNIDAFDVREFYVQLVADLKNRGF